jgi:hypothetical protein
MEIKYKSPERLQAQVESFADTGAKNFYRKQRLLLKNSSKLSEIEDPGNLPEDSPEEITTLVIENYEKYKEAIRSTPKEEIEFKKANIELYNTTFKSVIEDLKQRISETDNPKSLPEYLGSGGNGSAYAIEINGKRYAAKFLGNTTQINFEIKPLRQSKGIEHTAQLAAYSFDDGCIITDLLPGVDVTQISPEESIEYSDEHIIQLIDTALELYENGIMIDPRPSNFMYDKNKGFSVLDFGMSNGISVVGDVIIELKLALAARDWPKLDYGADNYQEQADKQVLEINKIELPIMTRFLRILKSRYPDIIESYRAEYNKREVDPKFMQSPLIKREHIPNHPDLRDSLEELAKLGF